MTVEAMRLGISRLRNPIVARIFRDAGFMESWGTGIRRVFRETAEAGLPEPLVEEIVDRLRVTIFIANHAFPHTLGRRLAGQRSCDQASDQASDQAGLLGFVSSRPATRTELLKFLGLADHTTNFRRHVLPLLEAGLLERTIPDRPTSPAQRYIATEAGRQLAGNNSGR